MRFSFLLRTFLLSDILSGLWLTLKIAFRRPLTLQYPYERAPLSPRFRGEHALRRYPSREERCVGCKLCEVICPAQAIYIRIGQRPTDDKRGAVSYVIDTHKCIFCGLCQEACPEEAIVQTFNLEFSKESRQELIYDKEKLLANGDKFEPFLKDALEIKRNYR